MNRCLCRQVWKANLSLWEHGLVFGTQGNVSGIDRDAGVVYIKPSGVPYEDLSERAIVTVSLDGSILRGTMRPSVDTVHHLALYRHIPSAGGVCHTHSRFATVFSVLEMPVPVLTTGHADVFGQEIPVAPYADNTGDAIARAFLAAHRKTSCPAVILARHGLFAVGNTPEKAAFHALMAEYCAAVSYSALVAGALLGRKIVALPEEEIRVWYERYHSPRYGQATGGTDAARLPVRQNRRRRRD